MTTIDAGKLKQLQKLFDEAETIYNKFSKEEQDSILGMHEELYSIPHCIRRWLQACNELLSDD